ncbi:hypothetical protein PN462_02975 [Spirulina sp. CS-785/01]|uniref:hypothetical protein n=1 Tax=Spirulina sp. CS-785/01 TaxID=3021716 RepID=UPI00232A92CF|nr:hypothetical protein [Spirulina sp. CS-785/01]MDB9312050.1 hypothetical protein [Spirulina sp. CS-785/01]
MAIARDDLLRCLKILVLLAKADGPLQPREQGILTEAIEELGLTETVSLDQLLQDPLTVESLLSQLQDTKLREIVYQSAYTLAYLDGDCPPSKQQIIHTIEKTLPGYLFWSGQALLTRRLQEAGRQLISPQVERIEDETKREVLVHHQIMIWSIVNAVTASVPILGVAISSDWLVYLNQLHLIEDIGVMWGYPPDGEFPPLYQVAFGGFGVMGLHLAIGNLTRLVGLGQQLGTTYAFINTWAIGELAHAYFAHNTTVTVGQLQQIFRESKRHGEQVYRQHREEIMKKQQGIKVQIDALNGELQLGQITEDEYHQKIIAFMS